MHRNVDGSCRRGFGCVGAVLEDKIEHGVRACSAATRGQMEDSDSFIIVWAFATVIEARWSSGENSKSKVLQV